MNCVLDAFTEYMDRLKFPYSRTEVAWIYNAIKWRTHNQERDVMTYAGIVPYMYEIMLFSAFSQAIKKPDVTFQINHTYVTYKSLLQHAETDEMKTYIPRCTWWYNNKLQIVNVINLQPAIYCMLNEQHAFFAVEPPDWIGARPIMAFQFSTKGE